MISRCSSCAYWNADRGADAGCPSLLHGEAGVHRKRGSQGGARLHRGVVVVVGDLGWLADKPASIRLAWRLRQAVARPATACFISDDRLSHSAVPTAVMEDVEGRRRMCSGCVVLWR